METNRFKQIDDYLQERLTNKEASEFEEELLHDKELSRQVQLCRELKDAILEEDVAFLRQKLSNISKEKPKSMRRPLLLKIAATFAILIVASTIIWKSYNSPDQLFSNYYARYELSGVGRDAYANSNTQHAQIIVLYKQGRLQEVIPLLEEYTQEHPEETVAKLILASAYIENDMALKAESLLITALNQNQEEIHEETLQWYLCLSYIQDKKYKEAFIESSKISARGGRYAKDAKVISSKLIDYLE